MPIDRAMLIAEAVETRHAACMYAERRFIAARGDEYGTPKWDAAYENYREARDAAWAQYHREVAASRTC